MKIKRIIYLLVVLVIFLGCTNEEGDEVELKFSCNDGIKNGDETGIDCGGSCLPCQTSKIPTTGFDAPNSYSGYKLVWNDEFNSNILNSSKWSFHNGSGCPNLCWWGNNELQYYTNRNENVYIEDGNLIIEARNEQIEGQNYSSARIHTDNKFEFKYGRVDIRASMPSADGTWVALWMLNHNYSIENPGEWWPKGGEVDIMEYLGEDNSSILGTAHYGSNLESHRYNSVNYRSSDGYFDEVYYVYSIIWEVNKITWLVNNVPYHSITPSNTNGQTYPFNDEFFLLMNLSVGGNLPSKEPIPAEFPAYLVVDYVRVYQKD